MFVSGAVLSLAVFAIMRKTGRSAEEVKFDSPDTGLTQDAKSPSARIGDGLGTLAGICDRFRHELTAIDGLILETMKDSTRFTPVEAHRRQRFPSH